MKLILERWNRYPIENVAYSGVVLDDDSRQRHWIIPEGGNLSLII